MSGLVPDDAGAEVADSELRSDPSGRVSLPVLGVALVAALLWWPSGFVPWLAVLGQVEGPVWTALPLRSSTYALVVGCAIVSGIGAGLAARLARTRSSGTLASLAGLVIAYAITVAQSVSALRTRGDAWLLDDRVLWPLCAALAAATLLAWALAAASMLGHPVLGIAVGVLAGVLPMWIGWILGAFVFDAAGTEWVHLWAELGRWVGAALLVLALVIVGARPIVRLAWWPVVVVVAWLVGPLITAAGYLEQLVRPGVGVDQSAVLDAFGAAADVFRAAANPANRPVLPWVVAILVAATLAMTMSRRGQAPEVRVPPHEAAWSDVQSDEVRPDDVRSE